MRVAILSARTGWHTDELGRALAERGHTGQVLPYEGLLARLGGSAHHSVVSTQTGAPPAVHATRPHREGLAVPARADLSSDATGLLDADAVLARIIPAGSLEQVIFRVDALHWLEEHGVLVMNSPRAIERCVDKFYTTALLQEAGLPVPETVVCEGTDEAMAAVMSMRDVIVKPIFGSMGHGLVRLSDPDVAFRVFRSLEQTRAVFYIQRALDHGGRDVRAFVVGDAVVGAIERSAPEGEWRSNVSRGGRASSIDLREEWQQLAIRAAAAVGADYAGVDLLPAIDGSIFVIEVNGIPGWQGLQQATGLDVAGTIVERLVMRSAARRSSRTELPV